ncbi:MAG: replication restart helicase PriA [Thermoguttaceae bacterium]
MGQKQQSLFDKEPPPWEGDAEAEQLVATVVFARGPAGEFDYAVPEALVEQIEPGRRVRVPLGRANRRAVGYCVRLQRKPVGARPLKPVDSLLDRHRLLGPSMLRLTQWIAQYYLCPWGQVLEAVVPGGVRSQAGTRRATLVGIPAEVRQRLGELDLPHAQSRVMKVLAAASAPVPIRQLVRAAGCSQGPIDALRRRGLVWVSVGRVEPPPRPDRPAPRQVPPCLNPDQQRALDVICAALDSGRHQTILIHGVTGSGKTEVYIRAIERVAQFGRQAIVLVPEISLTPQTVERFRSRFDRVAVLHSHLSDAERHHQWQQIAAGRIQIVIGARSAVFAPVPHLGLIVLDEEHEGSFKQESAPRYHARDVALARAQADGVLLVLGSATPSLESWYRAQSNQYVLVRMPHRVLGRPLPSVGTIDLRDDAHTRTSRGAISRQLHIAMREALEGGGQVILLLNRRGFSTHIQCPACGHVVRCPNCEIALTHHRTAQAALCHYCGYHMPAPTTCPKCKFAGIRFGGVGTQRLEAEVRARFPGVPCVRMDTDSMGRPGSYERALGDFRSGKVRILLGTQMIAKGLDFPEVTLVGVINADTALHFPDFRAAERTFQLVAQVAGRTGRGEKGGRVLVQTFNPDHPAIQAAVRHDYFAFAANELPVRQMFSYPPFTSMIRLVVRGPAENSVAQFAGQMAERLSAALADAGTVARVLGPAPAPFSKLRGRYRFQIQLQGPEGERLRQAVVQATAGLRPPEQVQWIADVDPLDML